MNATSSRAAPQAGVIRNAVLSALQTGTSFIGIWWLLEPLFSRLGWTGETSRGHLLFVGTFYAIAMTWFMRARDVSTSRLNNRDDG